MTPLSDALTAAQRSALATLEKAYVAGAIEAELMGKRVKLWQSRYERACAAAESVEEVDEALRRVHAKFPDIGLDKIIEEAQGDAA